MGGVSDYLGSGYRVTSFPNYVLAALVDLTNGASEEIRLTPEYVATNMDALFAKMTLYYEAGYLMGCARCVTVSCAFTEECRHLAAVYGDHRLCACSNIGSDTQVKDGIAQGHAYAIVRIYGDAEVRLIQLQNPW